MVIPPISNLREIRKHYWRGALAFFVTMVLLRLYIGSADFGLKQFADRTIGTVVLDGLDASMRSSIYWKSLILALLSFFAVFSGLGLLVKVIRRFNPNLRIGLETALIGLLASFCIVYQLLLNITGQPKYQILSHLSAFVILLIFITIFFKATVLRFIADIWQYLPHSSGTVGLFVVAIITPFILQPLFHQPISLTNWVAALYVAASFYLLVGGFAIASFYAVGSFSIQRSNLERSVLWGLMPLLLIPPGLIVANEIQFTLINVFGINTSPRKIYGILILLLVICSLLVFFISIRRFRNTHSKIIGAKKNLFDTLRKSQLLSYCYFPILVGTAALLGYHSHHLQIPNQVDLFHWGEYVLPTHQFVNFGKVPWLDIWPTHGLLDFFTGTLYSSVNGTSDVSVMVWSFLNCVVEYILVYLLTSLVAGPVFALFLIVSLPIATLFGAQWATWLGGLTIGYCCFIVVSALFIMKSIRSPSFGNFVMFWLAVFISGLLRYDVGLTAVLAGVITICMASFFNDSYGWQLLYRAVLAGAIVMGSCVFLIIVITIAAHHSPIDILKQFVGFIQCQEQSQSYSKIWPQLGNLAFFFYFICPVIPMAYITLVLLFPRSKGNMTDPLKWMIFFLAIATLVFGVRSLHRHSMMEGAWLTSQYLFILCCMPIAVCADWRVAVRVGMLLTVALIPITGVSLTETLLPARQPFEFYSWKSGEPRLNGNNDAQVRPLCTFLQNQLSPNETFFDFANGPLLYVYANKMFPGFLIPNLYHTSETTQLYELGRLQKKYAKNELPLIIFRGHWADVDQVPDIMRSYRITEFIYKHYSPFGTIGQYQLWSANDSRFQQIKEKIKEEKTTLPLNGEFKRHGISRSTDSKRLIVNCSSDDPYFWRFVDLSHINELSGLCPGKIRMHYKSSIDGRMQVFFGINGANFSEKCSSLVNVAKSEVGSYKQVDVPIVADTGANFKLSDLRIDPPDDSVFELHSVEMISCKGCFEPNPRVIQNINLRKLPYIWANYDPGLRWKQTGVIKDVKIGKTILPNQPLVLDFENCLDTDHGNYLVLKIASDTSAEIFCTIPGKDEGKLSFQAIGGVGNATLEYVVRISVLWNWWQNRGGEISFMTSGPVNIDEVSIRRGD